MAYGRGTRAKRLTKNRVYRKKPTARNQQNQIATLAKSIGTLQKQTRELKNWGTWSRTHAAVPVGAALNPVTKLDFMDKSNWLEVFNDPNINTLKSKFHLTSFYMDISIYPSTANYIVDMTVFIVSLRPAVATKIITETLNMTQLTSVNDYVQVGGLAMLNRDRYIIHHCKRTQTHARTVTSGTVLEDRAFHRYSVRKPWKKTLSSAVGNWQQVDDNDVNPASRLYMLVVNNNTGPGLAKYPTVSVNCIFKGYS